ncbi:MAG: Rieske (2Fe-2S) protein [Spongiibacteraceae bacterium]|jgi:nitrite reductase/ring-hydroxylating ferredoxin subunit|nr:Rieske (2Fe-2S) protein [Spongiibacteraceae bacterium]
MRYYQLAYFIDLHDGYRQVFQIEHHRLLLIQEAGQRYLIEATCPHRGHPLTAADVDPEAGTVRCALHDYRFALNTGALLYATEEPCRGLRRYTIVERERDLGVIL